MPRTFITPRVAWTAAMALAFSWAAHADAQTVWSGFGHSFTKAAFGDPTMAANQDRITGNVWLTRSTQQGLYNAKTEGGYSGELSPADTEWATDLITENVGKNIAATEWANLSFRPWVTAFGGPGLHSLPTNLTSNNAVLHLITDNIYLDLQFTNWSTQGGGTFSYNRATGTVTPPAATGDYNRNGVVDAADYVLWQDSLGQTVATQGAGADGNANGTIDAPDYTFWRARFGNVVPPPGGGASLAVPEPASIAMLGVAISVGVWFSRGRVADRRTRRGT